MIALLLLAVLPVTASGAGLVLPDDGDRAACFTSAAWHYGLSEELLRLIAEVESGGDARAVNRNPDGSQDIGIMQINTRWLPVLKAHGIGREDLFDACLNIFVGAWVLAGNIERFGPTWEAVGAYNAASRNKRRRYVHKIWKAWNGG